MSMRPLLPIAVAVMYVWVGRYVWQVLMGPHLKNYSYEWPWWAMPLLFTLLAGLAVALYLTIEWVIRPEGGAS